MTLLVSVAITLRVWPYAARTSLWLDEILISSNIVGLPMLDLLTKPLRLDQVAPGGFLLVEKLAVLVLGPSELALRLGPLLFSVAGVFLFRRLAERTLSGSAVPLAMALFAVGLPFLRYAAEVKQYGIDATAAILVTLLALDAIEGDRPKARLLGIGVGGLCIVWFSQAAVLVMAGIGITFTVCWLTSGSIRVRRALFIAIPLWAMASLGAVLAGMRSLTPATRLFMDDFWRLGFPPAPWSLASDASWCWRQTLSLFADPALLAYRWPVLFLALATIGIVALCQARLIVAGLLISPSIVCLIAALAHQYPFRGRLVLCLIPGLLIAVAAGAVSVARIVARLHPSLGMVCLLAFLWSPIAALVGSLPPYDQEHHRAVLSYLQEHRQPGDAVHVFPLTRIGFLYYGPQYGLTPHDWTTSVCDRSDTRAYLRDVDRYRGRARVWLVASGTRSLRVARTTVERYLDAIGTKRQSLDLPSPTQGIVSVELYDLSDPARLASASAESFPAVPMPTESRPGCRPWTLPEANLSVR